MSLIVNETFEGTAEVNELFEHRFTRVFVVQSSDQSGFGPAAATNAVAVDIADTYTNNFGETDQFAVCLRKQARCVSERSDVWQVTCEYGPKNPFLINANPLEIFPVATWSTLTFSRPIDIDINGNAIINTAGDLFDPPLEYEDFRPVLNIRRYETSFQAFTSYSYKNTTNLDAFFGADPKHALCADIRLGEPLWSGVIGQYFRVEYEFHFSRDSYGWQKKVLSAGYRELYTRPSDGALAQRPILVAGQPASSPVPLDVNGQAIDVSQPDWQQNITWQTFEIFPSVDFGAAFSFSNVIGV